MCSADDLAAHKRILCAEDIGINALQGISSDVVIAIAAGADEVCLTDAGVLHGLHHLQLVVFCDLVNGLKALRKGIQHRSAEFLHLTAYAQRAVHFLIIHSVISSFS